MKLGTTLKLMKEYAKVGISTKELDEYGGNILKSYGAKSAYKQLSVSYHHLK